MHVPTSFPPMPAGIAALPRQGQLPVPWFVAWPDGKADFRVLDERKLICAVQERRCLVCGEPLGEELAFPVGPMCVVNRVSAEPPSHPECVRWSQQVCPFLAQPSMARRDAGLPAEAQSPGGVMLRRNPGVSISYVTPSYEVVPVPNGVVFGMGEALRIECYREGRPATQDEVATSLAEGLPTLFQVAASEGPDALSDLAMCVVAAINELGLPVQATSQRLSDAVRASVRPTAQETL